MLPQLFFNSIQFNLFSIKTINTQYGRDATNSENLKNVAPYLQLKTATTTNKAEQK